MRTLLALALVFPFSALAERDGGACMPGGSFIGLSTLRRIDDALLAGACEEAQQVLNEALRCATPAEKVLAALRTRIEQCRRDAR